MTLVCRTLRSTLALILFAALSHTALASAAFVRGPLRVLPGNPRYFTADGSRATYLTGSHTWANFQDQGRRNPPPVFDYPGYLRFLRDRRYNVMRLWVLENARWNPSTLGDFRVAQLPYLRTGPGRAADGALRFDLRRWDAAYFTRLRERVAAAGEAGVYVAVMLFNGWSVQPFEKEPGNPWLGHPFNRYNNVNGIDGDPDYTNRGMKIHTLDARLGPVLRLQEAYVRKVIDTVGDLPNVLWEIGNELGAHSTDWQYHLIRFIREIERTRPLQHPIGMTFQWPGGHNGAVFDSPADWISPGEEGGYKTSPPVADGRKVVLTDTDHLWGIGGTRAWVWKSFLRGLHPIYMDPYNDGPTGVAPYGDPQHPPDEPVRTAMTLTAAYASRIDLAAMKPLPRLASSGYLLADPGREYLVYVLAPDEGGRLRDLLPGRVRRWLGSRWPPHASVEVDLSAVVRAVSVEWRNPRTGETVTASPVEGGAVRHFTAPFAGDAVLYLATGTPR